MRSPALIRSKSSQARTYSFWALSNFAATISAAQRLLGDDDAEFLVNPLAEIDDPPSHHAMNGGDRAALDDRGQRGSVRIVQPRRLSWRLAINQTVRPVRVELEHPIANDLKRHTANLRRLGASCPFVNRCQSQKPPCLRTILRSFRGGPDHLRVKIGPKRNGHGEPPLFATLNHVATDLKIPMRVTFSETWYKLFLPLVIQAKITSENSVQSFQSVGRPRAGVFVTRHWIPCRRPHNGTKRARRCFKWVN